MNEIEKLEISVTDGMGMIAAERRKQIGKGLDLAFDARWKRGELAMAAACYAAPEILYGKREDSATGMIQFGDPYPFAPATDRRRSRGWGDAIKPPKVMADEERVRLLVVAGALIAAEIDRIRMGSKLPAKGGEA